MIRRPWEGNSFAYNLRMHPILDRFEQNVSRRAAQLAVADQSLILTFGELCAIAGGLAVQIREQTERPRVGILLPTSSACAAAVLACWYAARSAVPLNFLLSPTELAKIIRDADLDFIVTIEPLAAALAGTSVRTLLLKGNSTLRPEMQIAPPATPDDIAVVLYTSGTTADPKGVCLTFDNLISNADACIEHERMTPDQAMLSVLPQFHSFGLTAMTVVPLVLGATVYYQPRFSPLAIIDAIREKQITIFMGVASMYGAMLALKHADREAFASLRLAVSGGEALPARVASGFADRFGVTICEGYGLTETSPVVAINQPWSHRAGSVGRPLPGVSVRIVDESGRALPAGAEGEVCVSGRCVMRGYHNNPTATAAMINDNELRTGDLGRVDADGFLFITGRAKDIIIIAGENVAPREIEEALLEHAAVAEAAVIGIRDELRGEIPIAYVVLREGVDATPAELREHCRERLAGYKVPREVRIATALPRAPTGKILKRALRGE